jgi:hypothetical protein
MKRARSWQLLCALHGLASLLLWWSPQAVADTFTWRADRWIQHPWTLWTGAWVHLNAPHLIGNLLVLAAYMTIGWVARPDGRCTLAWLLAWPLVQLSLLLWSEVQQVVGLSGLLHAGALVVAVHLALGRLPIQRARFWGLLLAVAVLSKVALEQAWQRPVVWDGTHELFVVQVAHLAGVGWGILLGLLTTLWPANADDARH